MTQYAQRFLHAETAGSYTPPTLTPRPMDFFSLWKRFWQLDSQQSFGASATRLYMFLLEEFNLERFPEQLTLSDGRLCLALDMTANTLKKARTELVERAGVRFRGGNKGRGLSGVYHLTLVGGKVSKNDTYGTEYSAKKVSDIVSKIDALPAEKVSAKVSKIDTLYKENTNTSSVVRTEDEEKREASSSSAAEVEVEKGIAPQPASQKAEPQSTQGAAAPELRKMSFAESRYATLEGLGTLARNLSFGKAYAPYYLAQIATSAEGMPAREERGWKTFCQHYLTNDARSPKGLVTQDPLAGQPQTALAGVGNLADRRAKQSQNDFL